MCVGTAFINQITGDLIWPFLLSILIWNTCMKVYQIPEFWILHIAEIYIIIKLILPHKTCYSLFKLDDIITCDTMMKKLSSCNGFPYLRCREWESEFLPKIKKNKVARNKNLGTLVFMLIFMSSEILLTIHMYLTLIRILRDRGRTMVMLSNYTCLRCFHNIHTCMICNIFFSIHTLLSELLSKI